MHPRQNSLVRSALATAWLAISFSIASTSDLKAQLPGTVRVFKTPAVSAAQGGYTTTVVTARKAYAQALDTALKAAMQSGNLAEANAINAVKTSLASGGVTPAADFKSGAATQAKTAYDTTIGRARAQYLTVLQTTQKSVLGSGDLKEANAIQGEIDEINGKPAVAPSTANTPARAGGSPVMESDDLVVYGTGFTPAVLEDDGLSWSNRAYRWGNVPGALRGAKYTKMNGGGKPQIKVRAKKDTIVQVITAFDRDEVKLPGWDRTGIKWTTIGNNAEMVLFKKKLNAGEELEIPHVSWACTLVVLPEK